MVASIGLLWVQLAFAAHMGCFVYGAAMPSVTTASETGCHHNDTKTAMDKSVCAAHCSLSDLANDAARLPAIPALLSVPFNSIGLFARLPGGPMIHRAAPSGISLHRPTLHPADLLLI